VNRAKPERCGGIAAAVARDIASLSSRGIIDGLATAADIAGWR